MSDNLTILHLGLGSFHRAHQAVYLQQLIDAGDTTWSLAGGNLRPDMPQVIAALQAQHGAYTLETVTPAGQRAYKKIESIRRIVPYDPQLAGLIEVGAAPSTRIISFTVTEAGYYLDSKNRLQLDYPDLASDLAGTTRVTIYGALAAILGERMRRNGGKVTLLNCDNLRGNGERFRAGFEDFLARRRDDALLKWIGESATTPNAMVDRITPRPPADLAPRVQAATGWADAAPVMGESFIQWVIEDHFANGRPAWEKAGAELVQSVLPYEEAKIRILNSSHSCIAWAGTLIGMRYIHEGTKLPAIRQMAYEYVTRDVIPCLTPSPLDLAAYRDVVLDRFSNPFLLDTNQRVAMDGFSKIPGFLWPTIRERLHAGQPISGVARLPALFYVFLRRWHDGKLPFAYEDQSMDPARAHALFTTPDPLAAFCRDPILWGPLAGVAGLESGIRHALTEVEAFLREHAPAGG